MCFNLVIRLTLILTTAFILGSCSNLNSSEKANLLSDQQVKEYVQQWHNQKQSINKLIAMQHDLRLIVAAFSAQTKAQKSLLQAAHLNPEHMTQWSQVHSVASDTAIGVQLGWYLKPQRVKTKVKQLIKQFPQAFNAMNFIMFQQQNTGTTVYGLRLGPFKHLDDAQIFCHLASKINQVCSPAAFVGTKI